MLVNGDGRPVAVTVQDGWVRLELKSVLDHEVVVLEG
jgi:hypothetical protein